MSTRRTTDRRRFLITAGAIGAGSALRPTFAQDEAPAPPGIDVEALARAESILDLRFTEGERATMLESVQEKVALYRRLREARLDNAEPPAERFDPRLPGMDLPREAARPVFVDSPRQPLPSDQEDIAFASIAQLSHWIQTRQISSVELTSLYLDRLKRFGPALECVVTLTDDLAMGQARRADEEIARGGWRGPLHGIPWGAKDLLDTKGIATTWGAMPYKDRVADADAAVVERLEQAGAVLVAKLTLGALAYGDIWFGGKTRNPFRVEQGSSGSSAGSASATAAGLVGFSIGTETWGSIGSPAARCGATGFRPTFGRVSRWGAMALCWTLDKIGPICRRAEDCAYVLAAIDGLDPRDPTTHGVPLDIDMTRSLRGMKVGWFEEEYEGRGVSSADRATLDALRQLGVELVPLSAPSANYAELISFLIGVEAAAAFDDLTRFDLDDQLVWQEPFAWPNLFRAARFVPAVEHVQATRLRRRAMLQCRDLFDEVEAIVAPQRHGAMHALTNLTGNPAITLRQPFRDDRTPRAVTLWGRVCRDGALLALGEALERELGVRDRRPQLEERS